MLVAYRKPAIDGTLDVWLPRLVESNHGLEQGLLLCETSTEQFG
jgi:hypothetical protein